jgi:tRNA(Ile)-lysidine synthase TilS/MesJ
MNSDEYFLRTVSKAVGSAIFDYKLFRGGDKVLVALSGGKDSLALTDILSEWNRRSPVKIDMTAAHIVIDGLGYTANVRELEDFCGERGVPFIVRTASIDFDREPSADKCFVCAWFRRKALFDITNGEKFGTLAFGHHLDDIVITLLMNMSFRGSFSTMPVDLSMFGGALRVVRPLCRVEERDIARYASLKGLPVQEYRCPFGLEQSRAKIRGILDQLASLDPRVKRNIFNSMSNIREEYLS